ncbi:MAG: hypothetical protein KAT46_04860 [Deltaproteobacteria bacterium]|nr:hypothetical protein [Deltaproteobacteria bacterium]
MKINYTPVTQLIQNAVKDDKIQAANEGRRPLPQAVWAKRIGLSTAAFNNWVNDIPKNPELITLLKISSYFKTPLPDLLKMDKEAYLCFVPKKESKTKPK